MHYSELSMNPFSVPRPNLGQHQFPLEMIPNLSTGLLPLQRKLWSEGYLKEFSMKFGEASKPKLEGNQITVQLFPNLKFNFIKKDLFIFGLKNSRVSQEKLL